MSSRATLPATSLELSRVPDKDETKILRVADASGWKAACWRPAPYGRGRHEVFTEPVVLWAIYSDGNVGGLIVGTDGRLTPAEDVHNFLGYCATGAIPDRFEDAARRGVEELHQRERMVAFNG